MTPEDFNTISETESIRNLGQYEPITGHPGDEAWTFVVVGLAYDSLWPTDRAPIRDA